ncbi:hypothetical protein F511_40900 [Dorcoceras hygrometricum]|uniref:Uncharacterized protein n=1 Tax=Dorcoceras hygrometricum TaxID=472368 RepID=A0A2Z7CYS0_9LAMI|nr:hypothetical protein F511_40900 [Dorcoceras hygrometricum]
MGSNPSTESSYKTAVNSKNKVQMLCIRKETTAQRKLQQNMWPRNGPAVCLWKFGLQCPTSPLLPPRKVPLEDLIYTSCTDPIPQPAAARTPRLHQPSAVTHLFYAYVRKATNTEFNVVVLGRYLILVWVIHSLNNFAPTLKICE